MKCPKLITYLIGIRLDQRSPDTRGSMQPNTRAPSSITLSLESRELAQPPSGLKADSWAIQPTQPSTSYVDFQTMQLIDT